MILLDCQIPFRKKCQFSGLSWLWNYHFDYLEDLNVYIQDLIDFGVTTFIIIILKENNTLIRDLIDLV